MEARASAQASIERTARWLQQHESRTKRQAQRPACFDVDRRSFARPRGLALPLDLLDRFLEFADVIARQLSRFGKLRHHRLRPAAEETQDFVEQTMAGQVARDGGLEDMCVADLPDAADGFLDLEAIDGR